MKVKSNIMNIQQVKALMERTLSLPQHMRATPFIWGPYGIGKSEMVRQFCEEQCEKRTKVALEKFEAAQKAGLNPTPDQYGLFEISNKDGTKRLVAFDPKPIDIRLSLKDSGDIQGLPTFHVDVNGVKRTTWAIPECFPSDPNWKGVIFFDEFNLGQMNVINACYQVLTEFQLEAIKFNPDVLVVCAGNYTEIAPNAEELPAGINTRVNHIDMVADLDIWCNWALNSGINPLVISFLKMGHVDLFYDYKALENNNRELPNPRAWVRVSAFLDLPGYDWEQHLVQDVSGIIGNAAAIELRAFIKDDKRFQNPDDILVKGKDFESENINSFYGCFINCVSKTLMCMTSDDKDRTKTKGYISNIHKAMMKLKKRELIAFGATSIMNSKLSEVMTSDPKLISMVADLAVMISGEKK